jgi:hypothetical protein
MEKRKEEVVVPMANDALEAIKPELVGMPEEKVRRGQKVDVNWASDMVVANVEKAAQHWRALEEEFEERASSLLHRLPIVARAARQAQVEYVSTQKSEDLTPARDNVKRYYTRLHTELNSCVQRGLIDSTALTPAEPLLGYQETIQSTLVLVRLARTSWEKIQGHTQLTKEEVDEAERLALDLGHAIARRDQGVESVPAAELRVRALSLLIDEYDRLRQMVSFVRWREGDADSITPSIFTQRGRRGSGSSEPEEPSDPSPVPPAGDDNPPFTP